MITIFGFRVNERQFLFAYLLAGTLLLGGLAGWVLYRSYDFPTSNAVYLADRIRRQQTILQQQERYLPLLDSAHHTIATYHPAMTALFVEADIDNQIDDIRRIYSQNTDVASYRAFAQAADFYRMMYDDKRVLWTKQDNVILFSKQLEECEVGFQPVAAGAASAPAAAPTSQLPRFPAR